MKGQYVYLPTVVDSNNETIIGIDEYYFESGNGNIEYIEVDNTTMLNITAYTDHVLINVKREKQPDDKWNLSYSSLFTKYIDGVAYNYTKIYYSGDNSVYSFSSYSFETASSSEGYRLGPLYFSNGWNEGIITGQSEIV